MMYFRLTYAAAMLILIMLFVGCASGKMIYMKGGKDAKAVIEASMTGGRVSLDGPFTYCSEPAVTDTGANGQKEVATSICTGLMGVEEEPESSE